MKAQEVVERALDAAPAGGQDLAVLVTESSQVNLRWAGNQLTTNGDVRSQQVTIVVMDPAGGTATTSGQARAVADVDTLVSRAASAAAAAAPAADRAPLVAGGTSPQWDEPAAPAQAAELSELTAGLGAAFRRGDGDGVEHFGYLEHDLTTTFLGTSAGTRLRHVQPQARVEFTAKSDDRRHSAWAGDVSLAADVAAVDEQLRLALRRQQRELETEPGRQRVVLSPSAVADLILELYWSADARSAVEGRSVFAAGNGRTRVGNRLGTGIDLWSDPRHAGPGMACAPFETALTSSDSSSPFDNGLPLERTEWVSDGLLQHLVTTRHTAQLAGLPVTPGIDNLAMAVRAGSGALADVVARTQRGLLVTCLWYNRVVDPQTLLVTGLTRDGVYVIRDGEIVGASGNFRFNESPVGILGRIVDAGGGERTLAREMGDYFNRATMPALVVDEFNLSTRSEAR